MSALSRQVLDLERVSGAGTDHRGSCGGHSDRNSLHRRNRELPPVVTSRGHGGVVTALPPVDTTIHEGDGAFGIDIRPTVFLVGDRPMFRRIDATATGADVTRLQEALARWDTTTVWSTADTIPLPDGRGAGFRSSWESALETLWNRAMSCSFRSRPPRVAGVDVSVGRRADGQLGQLSAPQAELTADIPAGAVDEVGPATEVEIIVDADTRIAA